MIELNIRLLLFHAGDSMATDIAPLVKEVRWSGRKGTPTRKLNVTLLDDDDSSHARADIDVENGMLIIFYDGTTELFQGIIMQQSQSDSKTMEFTAYDYGIYLSNNSDTFCYEGKTADQIFLDCCNRFGLKTGQVDTCYYVIPNLTKRSTTAWDVIADALGLEYQQTKTRHYVGCENGLAYLKTRSRNIVQWVIETGVNISSYTYNRSIERIRTRIKMISKENSTVSEMWKPDLESRIGVFQETVQPDESLSEAQLNDLINGMLNKKSLPEKTLSVTALGQNDVISGVGVYISIPALGLNQTFYVDEDVHVFKGDSHMMQLKLNFTDDTGQENENVEQRDVNNATGSQ